MEQNLKGVSCEKNYITAKSVFSIHTAGNMHSRVLQRLWWWLYVNVTEPAGNPKDRLPQRPLKNIMQPRRHFYLLRLCVVLAALSSTACSRTFGGGCISSTTTPSFDVTMPNLNLPQMPSIDNIRNSMGQTGTTGSGTWSAN